MKPEKYTLLAVITAIIILIVDLNIPLGIAFGVSYIIVVLIALQIPYRHAVILTAVICTLLVLMGHALSPEGGEAWKVYFNRAISIFSIWIVGLIGLIKKRANVSLQEKSKSISLMENIASIANETINSEDTIKTFIGIICSNLGWPIGHYYTLADDSSRDLVATNIWHIENAERFKTFCEVTKGTRFKAGVGLPGRVMSTGEPAWIVDVTKDANFQRAKYAEDVGIRAGFAFPTKIEDEVVGVFEFFSEDVAEPNMNELEIMSYVGDQFSRIIERRNTSKALHEAKEEAITATKTKSEFLANMSHEIRTPMNGIMGMVELALDTKLTQEQQEYLTTIDSSAETLLNLIDDILDFSKIEAEKLELDPIDFDLRERLGETLTTLAMRAHKKGLELAYEVDSNVPEILVADLHRLRQIIVNLVGNALKFTDQGEVVVRVKAINQTETSTKLQFSVSDTGIGIDKDKLDNIFHAFEQADTSTSRKYGGTGLGLTICSRLTELMGGKIWVESTPDWGTTFYFTVQFEISKQTKQSKMESMPAELKQLRILIVDDNKTNLVILKKMLLNWDMEPTLAESAKQGLDILQQADSSEDRYDLIISDLNMPEMDGFDFIESVRAITELSDIPIILLTSSQRTGDTERSRNLSIKEHLIKPIRQSRMFNAIATSIGVQYPDAMLTDKPESVKSDEDELTILLAEDNEVNQKFAIRALSKAGHKVTVANNGKEVLGQLDKQQFDLILMDLQMPEMDGFEATAAIRNSTNSIFSTIPIIALTAHAMKGDKEKCIDAGMNGYVTKPVKSKILLSEIAIVMKSNERSLSS